MRNEDYWTVKDVAAMLKLSEQTVRKYVKQGELPGTRVGRRIFIPKRQLEERLSSSHPANVPRLSPDDPATLRSTSEDDPLWSIVDTIDDPDGPTDVSANIHKYIADAIEDWRD